MCPPTSVLARCVLQINSQMNDDATGKGGKGGKGKGGGKGGGKGKGKGAGQDRLRGYVNNLLLKINEKMGGVNWTPHGRGLGLLRDIRTLVVGLDVQCAAPATQSRCPSHAAPVSAPRCTCVSCYSSPLDLTRRRACALRSHPRPGVDGPSHLGLKSFFLSRDATGREVGVKLRRRLRLRVS